MKPQQEETTSLLHGKSLPKYYIPRRYIIVALLHSSIVICYVLRVNLSVAVINIAAEYHWSTDVKGVVLSAFFWGYISTQLVGGYLSQRLGGKALLGLGVLWPSLFTCITPFVVQQTWLVILCRVVTGIGEGVLFPTIFNLVGRWVPFKEKGTTVALVWAGTSVGTILGTVTTPPIIESMGWPWVFYLSGFAGVGWFVVWMLLGADDPLKSKITHPIEAHYIISDLDAYGKSSKATHIVVSTKMSVQDDTGVEKGDTTKPEKFPERNSIEALKILVTKPAFWSIALCNLTINWGFYVLLAWLPTYYNTELHFSETAAGLMSVLPPVVTVIFNFTSGALNDFLMSRGVRAIVCRKSFLTLASVLPSIALILVSFVPLHRYVIAGVLAIGIGGQGFTAAGYTLNALEIAPKHASLVSGISNTFGTIPGIVGVASTGFLLTDFGGSWTAVFMAPVLFYVIGAVVFDIFCSCDRIV